jgi:hypothetical protein
VYNSVYTESGSTFTSLAGDYGGAIRLDTGTLSLTNSVFSTVRAYIGGTIYLKDQVTVTINGITVTDSEGRYYGGFLYATGSLASTITFSGTNTFTTLNANSYYGGMFYLDNPVLNLYMQCAVTVTTCNAASRGGVFYIN